MAKAMSNSKREIRCCQTSLRKAAAPLKRKWRRGKKEGEGSLDENMETDKSGRNDYSLPHLDTTTTTLPFKVVSRLPWTTEGDPLAGALVKEARCAVVLLPAPRRCRVEGGDRERASTCTYPPSRVQRYLVSPWILGYLPT